ncbi:MAG TPA: hypothetical protein VNL71_24780 [Chloroflexota bacterium]|nr:hypothetical protein [Chloroflexota bacterium]
MKSISIRELHEATGQWVRKAAHFGEVHVTERGKVVAKLLPAAPLPAVPYFARRKLAASFQAARLSGGTDSTMGISAERSDR